MTAVDRSARLHAAVMGALPIDPDDGTVVTGFNPDGVPLWSKPDVLAAVIVVAVEAVLAEDETEWRDEWLVTAYRRNRAPGADRVIWARCADEADARSKFALVSQEGWPEPWIEHRRVAETEWERVPE